MKEAKNQLNATSANNKPPYEPMTNINGERQHKNR